MKQGHPLQPTDDVLNGVEGNPVEASAAPTNSEEVNGEKIRETKEETKAEGEVDGVDERIKPKVRFVEPESPEVKETEALNVERPVLSLDGQQVSGVSENLDSVESPDRSDQHGDDQGPEVDGEVTPKKKKTHRGQRGGRKRKKKTTTATDEDDLTEQIGRQIEHDQTIQPDESSATGGAEDVSSITKLGKLEIYRDQVSSPYCTSFIITLRTPWSYSESSTLL
jgi:hypothetical protein